MKLRSPPFRLAPALVITAIALGAALAQGHDGDTGFTAEQVTRILSHGPWAPKAVRDASNRVSGNPEAIAFGERLFFDTRISANGLVSCARCHQPGRFFTDGHERSIGIAPTDRNASTIVDLAGRRWFGWDGAHDNLWSQSIRPIVDVREMGMTPASLAAVIRREPDFACRYRLAFGREPAADDVEVLVDVGKALAAFQETLRSGRTPFDEFRDALARGDRAGIARYPAAAKRGLKTFIGRGACNICHVGPAFTSDEFHETGLASVAGRTDTGRRQGIERLRTSPFSLAGLYNDDPKRSGADATRQAIGMHGNVGEFRVPGLRNVAGTAPYMHDGSLRTLRDVVRHYSELDEHRLRADGKRILKALRLTERESEDLVTFLETLGDGHPAFRLAQRGRPTCDPS